MSGSFGSWEPIDADAGLFSIEKTAPSGWSLRTHAVRLSDGELLVVSPIRGLAAEAGAELERLGRPAAIFAPNHFHHLGIPEALERWPGASAVASDVARPRLARKRGLEFAALSSIEERLPPNVRMLVPEGTSSGEAWVRVETARGVAWVVSDAFVHVNGPVRGGEGLFLRATGTAPGLRIGGTFTFLALRDRRAYAAWLLAQIEADRPTMLVPGHGEVLASSELPDRLQALASERLPH